MIVSPSGSLFLNGIGFSDGAPDAALSGAALEDFASSALAASAAAPSFTSTPLFGKASFASRALTADLVGVLGSGGAARVAALATEALVAIRRRPGELIALLGAALPLSLPGAASPRDVGALRARLLLIPGIADEDARTRLGMAMTSFLL